MPKRYYYVHSQHFKGVCKFIGKDEDISEGNNFIFTNPLFVREFDSSEDHQRFFDQRDIIREADKEEIKEVLIDEL